MELREMSLAWTQETFQAHLGPVGFALLAHCFLPSLCLFSLGEDSAPGQLRRFYTARYKMIDQFDRLLAEIRLKYKFKRWETSYLWWLIEISVVESYVAWCEYYEQRVPLKAHLKEFVAELVDYISSMS